MSNALVTRELNNVLAGPLGNLDTYIQQVRQIPMLSAEEEKELATRLQRDNDLDAASRLILAHLRFVVHIARGYNGYGLPMGDLIQEGNIGLMKAVKRFDPSVGVRLVSFAVHWIRAEIHEFILRNWRIVKVATTKAQRKLFFNLRSNKKRLGWFSRDEVEQVARDLNVKPETVLEMESRLSGHDVGFDGFNDDDDERPFSPSAWLESPEADPAYLIEHENSEEYRHERLAEALEQLDERSRDILASRWLGDNKATLHELADKYGVSAERIRQIEAQAIKKLRGTMAA